MLRPVLGPIAYLSRDVASNVDDRSGQLNLVEVRHVYEPPTFVIQLDCFPYSAHFEYPNVVPGHIIRCLVEGRARAIAVGSLLAVADEWIYCQCYGYECGGMLDVAGVGVLKAPRVCYGGQFRGDLDEKTTGIDVERVCKTISADMFWSAELLFPLDFPHEVIGWWDIGHCVPPSVYSRDGTSFSILSFYFLGYVFRDVLGCLYNSRMLSPGDHQDTDLSGSRGESEEDNSHEISSLEQELSRMDLNVAPTYRVVEPEVDPERYLQSYLLLEITEVFPGRKCECCARRGSRSCP